MIIKNGKVVLHNIIKVKDIKIENGKISRIDDSICANKGEELINANGRYVLPGFIDIHTHLDDTIGEFPLADDFHKGSIIAALNGVTSIYNFITERYDRPLKYAIEEFTKKAKKSVVNYGFHLTPINFNKKDKDFIKRLIDAGFNSFKFYTTYRDAGLYMDYEKIENIVKEIMTDKTLFLVHCEDDKILSEYYCFQYSKPIDHLTFRPKEAEVVAIKRIIQISRASNARFHVVHCSSKEGVESIKCSRDNIKVTVETCPQYLVLHSDLLQGENGHRFFCTPPIRDKENMLSLRQMAQEGLFDIFASDHAPFTKEDKDKNRKNLRKTPNGLPGIGALPHIIYKILREKHKAPYLELSKRLSENPSKIMNLFPDKGVIQEGADADIVIISESKRANKIIPTLSNSYNPYKTFYSNLKFDYVIIGGTVVVKNGIIINYNHKGRCLNDKSKGI
ncbi:MAG: amidohydrolase family protein [Deltaproteobacteria bacterium]|nr:amidohydrolase family protein [Deltaproteobacteria bacterium]